MIGNYHRDASIVQRISNPGSIHFVTFDVEAEFATEQLIGVRSFETAIVSEDLRIISPHLKELLPYRGVYSPCKECELLPVVSEARDQMINM